MGLGHGNIGLPTRTLKRYKTINICNHTVKSVNKSWHGTNVGWNVWIDGGKKYFCNRLTREEAVQYCLLKYMAITHKPKGKS